MAKRDDKGLFNHRCWWLLMLYLPSSLCVAANTQEIQVPNGVDISRWSCSYCMFEDGYKGEIEAGIGYVSDDSFKFGEFTGLNNKGLFLIGNASVRYRNNNADYLNFNARDLGIDSRFIHIEAGQQGKYRLFMTYHEIPHYIADSTRTPYRGSGTDNLRLPSAWLPAGSTGGMTDLAASLHDVELKTQRQRLTLGASYLPASHWETSIQFRHEVRDGQIATAGSFYFKSAQLIQPVDYVTNEAEVSASYIVPRWQLRLAYYGSFFNNHDSSLTWQNAYNPIVPGAVIGQLALPPSNRFQQLQFSSGYQLSQRTRINADVAIGRMEQDESLLAATKNRPLEGSLPESSANARVDTLVANLKLNSRVNNKLHLRAGYRYNDRDNKTPSESFNWVTTDAFINVARRNLPYSFTDRNFAMEGDYRFNKKVKAGVGYENAVKDRTHQEVDQTKENTVWGKMTVRAPKGIDVTLKAARAIRNASGYNLVDETDPPQNPLMRKYNMADRDRNTGSLQVGINSIPRLSLELSFAMSFDNYSDSALGLTQSDDSNLNADAWLMLGTNTSLHAFAGFEEIKSEQTGSQSFSNPDWFARNHDYIENIGIGLKHDLIQKKISLGADYTLIQSRGRVRIDTGAATPGFPDLKSNLITFKLYGDYRLQENMTLHAAYWYEYFHSTDWMLDGVDPATVSNVLALGSDSSDYNVQAIMMTVRYRF